MASEPELSAMIYHRRKAHIFRMAFGSVWRNATMSRDTPAHPVRIATLMRWPQYPIWLGVFYAEGGLRLPSSLQVLRYLMCCQ